ncbi:hypothetical protein IEQ34_004081 [Dendrobium chrysotoxum]|uniref:Uncharacterized protein n=1 Tax=Dendrobium chrysotoxum TaxID=161865 RepID=A0AAV7HFM3_DENCH|nr:hypothetical protein IEQ34_004081 [Dendrobium chrysotoxum]
MTIISGWHFSERDQLGAIFNCQPKKRSKGCNAYLHSKRASTVDFFKEVEEGEEEHGGEEEEEEEEENKEEEGIEVEEGRDIPTLKKKKGRLGRTGDVRSGLGV